jgi:PIN domain nuclease of toxin-antitoxin system
MNYVTDTHALIWWFIDSPKISSKAAEIFKKCERGKNVIFIPSIVMAEALTIFEKKKVSFNFKNLLQKIDASQNFMLIALDYPLLQEMMTLKDIPEIHDKIIASTAKHLKAPIITKDKTLQKSSFIKTIW